MLDGFLLLEGRAAELEDCGLELEEGLALVVVGLTDTVPDTSSAEVVVVSDDVSVISLPVLTSPPEQATNETAITATNKIANIFFII